MKENILKHDINKEQPEPLDWLKEMHYLIYALKIHIK